MQKVRSWRKCQSDELAIFLKITRFENCWGTQLIYMPGAPYISQGLRSLRVKARQISIPKYVYTIHD